MSMDNRAGHLCLTTLEYALQTGTTSLTTHCPSCGLRLIIRYDNLVNRATSLAVVIGISAFIGYHIGANRQWIKRLCRRLLHSLGFQGQGPSSASSFDTANNSKRSLRRSQDFSNNNYLDNRSDSAIDFYLSDNDDYDEQLYEMTNYNKYYDDLFYPEGQHQIPFANYHYPSNIHSKTVDKIDQVLHQIDDIKKSIVEIDDELYHVSGSKYASFNPDFFTLTDYGLEEFHDDIPPQSPPLLPRSDTFLHSKRLNHNSKMIRRQQHQKSRTVADSSSNMHEDHRGKLSRLSFGSIDNLQLEWDESECSFYFYNDNNNQMKEDDGSSMDRLSSSSTAVLNQDTETPSLMTDEQKLKNMHELLEEAKRLGLLNNIIDAFLNPSTTGASLHRKLSTSCSSENEDDEI